jgi:hypothetical protein
MDQQTRKVQAGRNRICEVDNQLVALLIRAVRLGGVIFHCLQISFHAQEAQAGCEISAAHFTVDSLKLNPTIFEQR